MLNQISINNYPSCIQSQKRVEKGTRSKSEDLPIYTIYK